VPNASSLQPTSALTITGWILANAWGSGSDVDIILRKGEANPNNYQLAVVDQRLCLVLDSWDYIGYSGTTNGDTILNTNEWYFVAGTWDGSNVCIYVNGILDNDPPDSYTGTIDTDTRPLYIGGRSGTDCLDGTLDDVRLYSRALTAEEISALASGKVFFRKFSEAKTKKAQSLLIPTPGAGTISDADSVSFLGGQAAAPFTVPAGSNRLLINTVHVESWSADLSLDGVTYGGGRDDQDCGRTH